MNTLECPILDVNTATDSVGVHLQWAKALPASSADLLAELFWIVEGLQSVETILTGSLGDQHVIGYRLYFQPELIESALPDVERLLNDPCHNDPLPELTEVSVTPIARDDWAHAWKAHWHAMHVSPRVVICPTWETYTATADEIVVTLDPGGAFGTGSHGTTRMAIEALDAIDVQSPVSQSAVLDLGCGSGVLAIVAAKLGCRDIAALDIVEEALEATKTNATLNGVSHCITTSLSPLAERCMTPFDVILANIQAGVILDLLPEILARLNAGGVLVATGIIPQYQDDVVTAFTENGLGIDAIQTDGEWVLIQATYKPSLGDGVN